MIKYTDEKGVAVIGEKLRANKTAIEGTLDTISTLNEKVSSLDINWEELTGFAKKLEELVGCRT